MDASAAGIPHSFPVALAGRSRGRAAAQDPSSPITAEIVDPPWKGYRRSKSTLSRRGRSPYADLPEPVGDIADIPVGVLRAGRIQLGNPRLSRASTRRQAAPDKKAITCAAVSTAVQASPGTGRAARSDRGRPSRRNRFPPSSSAARCRLWLPSTRAYGGSGERCAEVDTLRRGSVWESSSKTAACTSSLACRRMAVFAVV
jgi:hypothetical protein